MTIKKRQFATRVVIGAVSAVMAAVGCSEYPAELAGPPPLTTNSLPGPASVWAGGEAASALDEEDDDEYSYSQGAPVFSTAAVEDGAAGYWTWVYPEKCVKYRVLNRTVQFQTCEEQMVKVWVPAPAPTRGTTPKPSPSPSPVASPKLPSGAKPSVKPQGEGVFWFRVHHYFSPNDDTRKDTARIDVVATPDIGPWELSVDGQNLIIARGEGSKLKFLWDGKLNGVPLADGRYTLRLRAGNAVQTANTVVDTTAPEITDYKVDGIEQVADSENLDYTFVVDAKDPLKVGVASDLDVPTTSLEKSNVPFTELEGGKPFLNKDRLIEFKKQTRLGFEESLNLSLVLQDKAGNRTIKDNTVAEHIVYSGFSIEESNVCNAAAPAYRTQFVVKPVVPGIEPVVPAGKPPVVPAQKPPVGGVGPLLVLTAGQVIINVAADHAERRCLAPFADFKLQESVDGVAVNRAIYTPFIYVNGRRTVKYYAGFGVIERKTGQLDWMGTSAMRKLKLYTNVTFFRERDSRLVYSKTQHLMSNIQESVNDPNRYIAWDGRDQRSGAALSTDKYKVAVTLHKSVPILAEGEHFESPNQRKALSSYYKIPPGYGMIYPEHTLVGFRVINNADHAKFGPQQTDMDKSFSEQTESAFVNFKNRIGPAGWKTSEGKTSHQWHHIVEKNQSGFPIGDLNSTENLVRIPDDLHAQISNYYNGIDKNRTGSETLSVRKWLAQKYPNDWTYQYNFGLARLKEVGWSYEIQEDRLP